ncbi:DUF2442 domain-containing protein [Methylococcus sp. EFPC2]|uniref:DUF2442 domain-containing protein n=1 Tax=Methylococcus sp. EFPC2 TaxID=2812648 RepID=UPI0019671391|nr:DUF2442 domain-containing protein [Methylococcus sp. EFPC2]QSA99295.1 DUF2442 domain-containing protein [Methylococcus sp. EFPC2]
MKLKHFERHDGYRFLLVFENGESKEIDLEKLIGQFVQPSDVNTARIDAEWGCLEFMEGAVDIEPKTLYSFATDEHHQVAA